MLRNYAFHDGIEDVVDLRSTDDALVIGDISIPGLKRYVASVSTARRLAELKRAESRLYTRIIVGGLSPELVADFDGLAHRVIDMVYEKDGLAVFSFDDESGRARVKTFLDNNYPYATHWTLRSRHGELVVTDAKAKDRFVDEAVA